MAGSAARERDRMGPIEVDDGYLQISVERCCFDSEPRHIDGSVWATKGSLQKPLQYFCGARLTARAKSLGGVGLEPASLKYPLWAAVDLYVLSSGSNAGERVIRCLTLSYNSPS
jgi:hypothetical protein